MEYKVIKSNRKTMTLSVNDNLEVIVKAPIFVSNSSIDDFVKRNALWINNAIYNKKKQLEKFDISDDEIDALVKKAKAVIPSRVEHYSNLMKIIPTGIKITKAKKRFGSCNGKNSLCFSCYLMLYPNEAVDYVVVHELAHIKHHNHSKDFYSLISKYMPDYKDREKLLKA